MKLKETTNSLFEQFRTASTYKKLQNIPINIASFPFTSENYGILPKRRMGKLNEESNYFPQSDAEIKENKDFSYHIVLPQGKVKFDKAIIMMHGLNEKSWKKYLPWATQLAMNTGSPIILFPFAFHMDRAPSAWSQPRSMQNLMLLRKQHKNTVEQCSFMNVALSERLESFPHRFYLSGYQTAMDLFKLIESIKYGHHPLFKEGAHVDLFAYSIGAFLAQIMLIADDEKLLHDSKLMLFCGGAVFQDMIGESKLIMDNLAFNRLLDYFINNLEKDILRNRPYTNLLKNTKLGSGFRAMIGINHNTETRETAFRKHASKMHAIGLEKDTVIPANKILTTMRGNDKLIPTNVDILDFPFEYSHENPFPTAGKGIDDLLVDKSFEDVFGRAGQFLSA
jgi:hypothetical protein